MPSVNTDDFDAVLFDLDGVLTPTAEVHMRAWGRMFSEFLAGRSAAPYADADYFAHIDGKPRLDGVRAMLASRGIVLPEGAPGDDPVLETVAASGTARTRRSRPSSPTTATRARRASPPSSMTCRRRSRR